MPRGVGPDTAGRRSGGATGAGGAAARPATTTAAAARKRRSRTPAAEASTPATLDVDGDTVDLRDPPSGGTGSGSAPVDGRSARAERTRAAIVDALLSLLEDGDLMPTAHRVAERAGVSLRLIYHHFGDLESLFQAVTERQSQRMEDLLVTLDPDHPLEQRIDELVSKRVSIYERMAPVRRASMLQEPFSPTLIATRENMTDLGRHEVMDLFRHELAALPDADHHAAVNAITAALSWGSWNMLDQMRRDHDEIVAALTLLVRGVLMPLR